MKKTTTLASAMLAGILACTAHAQQSGDGNTVTTNTYDAGSTSSNIDESCTNLGFSNGNIIGACNYSSGSQVVLAITSLVADDNISCVAREDTWGYVIDFTTSDNPDGVTLTSEEMRLTSNGQKYQFVAVCHDNQQGLRSSLRLNEGVTNVNGSFTWASSD